MYIPLEYVQEKQGIYSHESYPAGRASRVRILSTKKIKNKNKGGMELIKSTHEIVTMAGFDEGSCPVIDVFKMFSVIAFGGSTKLLIAIKIASL